MRLNFRSESRSRVVCSNCGIAKPLWKTPLELAKWLLEARCDDGAVHVWVTLKSFVQARL